MYTPHIAKASILTGAIGLTVKSLAVVVVAFAFIGIGNLILHKIKSKNNLWK